VVGQDTGAQLRGFEQAMAASRADWKVVVGHHPIYSGNEFGGAPELQAAIDPILQRHGALLYLNGHDHDLQHVSRGASHYVCTGAGSKMNDHCADSPGSDFCSVRPGFVALRLSRRRLQVAYRDDLGAELHVVDIPHPA
jgi:tartrate-resistant acid phosphatase type 5